MGRTPAPRRRPPRLARTLSCAAALHSVLVPGLLDPDSFLDGGIGGGALALPVMAIIGGAALSGRGPRWRRACCAAVGLASIPIWALTATAVGGPLFALHTIHGLWAALPYDGLIGIFCLAASVPQRRVVSPV